MVERIKTKVWQYQNAIRPRTFILMYHRVTDLEIDPWGLSVSKQNFEEQIAALKKNYKVICLNELLDRKAEHRLEDNLVAITFDDGYRDNYYNAFPILEKYNATATFFVNSEIIEKQIEFWPDTLIRLLLNQYELPKEELRIESLKRRWHFPKEIDEDQRFHFFMDVWYSLLQLHPKVRQAALDEIAQWAEHETSVSNENLPMTTSQLKEISKGSLIEIGGHTSNHAALGFLNKKNQREEILTNKTWLENVLDKSVHGFAYPNGSYNYKTISLMQELGFHYACTTNEMRNSAYTSNYRLPRFQVYDWSGLEFINHLNNW